MAGRDEVFVSLQRTGSEDEQAADLHRAAGMIVSATVVLVPSLPRASLDDVHDGHVLVVPADGRAHRAAVSDVSVRGAADSEADGPVAAMLTLAAPLPDTVARSAVGAARFDRHQLAEALRATHGDLGAALRDLGVAEVDGRTARVIRLLEGVRGKGLPVPGRPRPRFLPPDEVAHWFCDYSPLCRRGQPPSGGGGTVDP